MSARSEGGEGPRKWCRQCMYVDGSLDKNGECAECAALYVKWPKNWRPAITQATRPSYSGCGQPAILSDLRTRACSYRAACFGCD